MKKKPTRPGFFGAIFSFFLFCFRFWRFVPTGLWFFFWRRKRVGKQENFMRFPKSSRIICFASCYYGGLKKK